VKDGLALLLEALAFAAHKHRDQRRKDAEASPYINHPIALADKICNLRDVADRPPSGWDLQRRREYFEWAKAVVDRLRGTQAEEIRRLAKAFDEAYARRPA
jgi:guanosine-3',5'-bis(diphosphate) 3'-pyrophosphohydrolase